MSHHYCCYFDHRYLPRGLAMIHSLRRFDPDARIWVLCLSEGCYELMTHIDEPNVHLIRMAELEAGDGSLTQAKSNRSLIEYYFTCTPSLVSYVLKQVDTGEFVTYVDGDLYFFSDPAPLFHELGSGSVSIVPHRFAEKVQHLERFGAYNVGWLTFRNDGCGRAVADWWRMRCNEWCYDVLEGDRFADQKYLEQFSKLFRGVVVLRNPGANVAPWNLGRHELSIRNSTILVDAVAPLIFFHFHGMRTLGRSIYLAEHHRYGAPFNGLVRRRLYRPYAQAVSEIASHLGVLARPHSQSLARVVSGRSSGFNRLIGGLKNPAKNLIALARGEFIVVLNGKAI